MPLPDLVLFSNGILEGLPRWSIVICEFVPILTRSMDPCPMSNDFFMIQFLPDLKFLRINWVMFSWQMVFSLRPTICHNPSYIYVNLKLQSHYKIARGPALWIPDGFWDDGLRDLCLRIRLWLHEIHLRSRFRLLRSGFRLLRSWFWLLRSRPYLQSL